MKAKTRITKKTLGWIAAAFLLAGMVSACKEAEGILEMQTEKYPADDKVTLTITPSGATFISPDTVEFSAVVTLGGKTVPSPLIKWTLSGYKDSGTTLTEAATASAEEDEEPAAAMDAQAEGVTPPILGNEGETLTSADDAPDEAPTPIELSTNVPVTLTVAQGETAAALTITATVQVSGKPVSKTVEVKRGYTVTIDGTLQNGAVESDKAKAAAGDTVTLTVSPEDGYYLPVGPAVTYGGDQTADVAAGGGNKYTFTMPAAHVTVGAEFEEIPPNYYSITIGEGLQNGTVVSDASGNYAVENSTVTLTVTPDNGYQLKPGTLKVNDGAVTVSEGGTDNTYTFTMPSADVVVTAEFEAVQYSINAQASNGTVTAKVEGSAATTAAAGQQVTLTVSPATEYQLDGTPTVTYGGSQTVPVNGSGPYTFTMPSADVTVGAVFISNVIHINEPAVTTGNTWTYNSNVVTISGSGPYIIKGATTANRVVVAANVTANITLNDVSIDVSGVSDACAFYITPGATANITLAENTTNTLKSNGTAAGLQVPNINNTNATLVIASAAGAGSTSGTLNAYGGLGTGSHSGAGIGGGQAQNGGTITINSGTVYAYGFDDGSTNYANGGAGIGGGGYTGSTKAGDGGTITITGGKVTAVAGSSQTQGGEGAAGIGGGSGKWSGSDNIPGGSGGNITITGGEVIASSRINGAGIGGGNFGVGGNITISDGMVTATGGDLGAGIGGGYKGVGGNITISGGTVTAMGGVLGAGIGGGYKEAAGTIAISGLASVTATGGDNSPGIGSGQGTGSGSANNISIYGTGYTGNGNGNFSGNRGNGQGSLTTGNAHTITINGSGSAKVIATSGVDTKCAIGEGDY